MPYTYLTTTDASVNPLANVPAGSWYSDQTQAPLAADTPITLSLNHTDFERYITLVGGTAFRVSRAGVYNLQWSAQVYNSDGGGTTAHAEIWLRKNGIDIPGSAGRISATTNNRYNLPAWNYFVTLAVNDTLELRYMNNTAGINIVYLPPDGTPGTASLLVTMNQVA